MKTAPTVSQKEKRINYGTMHFAASNGGRPFCGSRRAIMSTENPDHVGCHKCNAILERRAQRVQKVEA